MKAKKQIQMWMVFVWTMVFMVGGVWAEVLQDNSDGSIYRYGDDFSTKKAVRDSYDHSDFWPENAFPPAEPYLYYSSRYGNPAPGLVFMGFKGQRAHLNYCFPIKPVNDEPLRGVLKFDLKFLVNAVSLTSSADRAGYMCYSISPDGKHWTIPSPLKPGAQAIKVGSHQGTCYVSLSGHLALIDNLAVELNGPQPNVIRVPGDFDTIQEGIDAARDGQVVEVGPGTWTGEGNMNLDFMGKAITVRSAKGARYTIIDCRSPLTVLQPLRGFYFHRAERRDSVVEGFTIRHGRVPGYAIPGDDMRWNLDAWHPIGAGIYCEFSSPTIRDCVIEDCGTEIGGGIGCVSARPMIERCKIIKCRAGGFGDCRSGGRGGAIGLIRFSGARVLDCEMIGNQCYYNSQGGAVYTRRSRMMLQGSKIAENGAPGNLEGGGVYCGAGSDMVVENCIISNNVANAGAGIFSMRHEMATDATSLSPDCCFCDLLVKNCTIAHNRLVYPMPVYPGAGIHSLGTDILVKNCIVYFNKPTQIVIYKSPSRMPVIFSDVQGGYPTTLENMPEAGSVEYVDSCDLVGYPNPADVHSIICPGNIDEDPLFGNPLLPNPDYHLKSYFGRYVEGVFTDPAGIRPGIWVRDKVHSPCIDAGDPRDSVGGELPPNGHRINMGAYGGTWQASKSKGKKFEPDLNGDGVVNILDFIIFAQHYMMRDLDGEVIY